MVRSKTEISLIASLPVQLAKKSDDTYVLDFSNLYHVVISKLKLVLKSCSV